MANGVSFNSPQQASCALLKRISRFLVFGFLCDQCQFLGYFRLFNFKRGYFSRITRYDMSEHVYVIERRAGFSTTMVATYKCCFWVRKTENKKRGAFYFVRFVCFVLIDCGTLFSYHSVFELNPAVLPASLNIEFVARILYSFQTIWYSQRQQKCQHKKPNVWIQFICKIPIKNFKSYFCLCWPCVVTPTRIKSRQKINNGENAVCRFMCCFAFCFLFSSFVLLYCDM